MWKLLHSKTTEDEAQGIQSLHAKSPANKKTKVKAPHVVEKEPRKLLLAVWATYSQSVLSHPSADTEFQVSLSS